MWKMRHSCLLYYDSFCTALDSWGIYQCKKTNKKKTILPSSTSDKHFSVKYKNNHSAIKDKAVLI